MIELSTYRHVVLEMLVKAGFTGMLDNQSVQDVITSSWHKRLSARECAAKITRGEA